MALDATSITAIFFSALAVAVSIVLGFTLTLGIAQTPKAHPWTPAEKRQFADNTCAASDAYNCECMISKLQDRVPFDALRVAMDARDAEGERDASYVRVRHAMSEAMYTCSKQGKEEIQRQIRKHGGDAARLLQLDEESAARFLEGLPARAISDENTFALLDAFSVSHGDAATAEDLYRAVGAI